MLDFIDLHKTSKTYFKVQYLTFTRKRPRVRVLTPLLLLEALAALVTLNSAGIVLTLTGQDAGRRSRVQHVTGVGVTITHAPSSDGDILDRVEVL